MTDNAAPATALEPVPAVTDTIAAELAEELEAARVGRSQIRQLSQRYPEMSIEDGYRVNRAWSELRQRGGREVRGHKIGLTSVAMQRAVGITEPDYGTLFDDMFFEDGQRIDPPLFITPKVEVELAFVMARDLTAVDATIFDVLDATAYVVPALEIIDARIERIDSATGASRTVKDTIADNAASAGVVTGGRPVRPHDLDLRRVGAILMRNGIVEETGVAAGVLNHPANGVAWLARRLARWGEYLHAGELVLGGSFTRLVDVSAGDVFTADYGDLGTVSFSMGGAS
ncbi:2-oxo-hept-4-ene-1,7-dioate hydratase [Rhodococcus sp. NCIMB 12038]|uniref:2-oxo-hept-4-ene-1,7-dioate hydratase n=1 Tax=Rhodococcus sp. NCIMB 12038 TaxID=933800 RepID=UPI000B3C567F|nr:2-oxo-hepta-3-ene-1,7-dioic acid hydratase [Rhodococcus sp. NCIMB 12038]OUS92833.1 2-oxo-hepta-3-ene-1,7-dioic acid hydratase [Rhodococcus sp. NCIMB 12038]